MLFDTSESMRRDLRLSQQSAVRFLDAIPRNPTGKILKRDLRDQLVGESA